MDDKGMYSKHLMPDRGGLIIATLIPLLILGTAAWCLWLGGRIY